MSKHENPYNEKSIYHVGFGHMQSKQVTTRTALIAVLTTAIVAERKAVEAVPKHLAKRYKSIEDYRSDLAIAKAAQATATVLLSPRAEGNCRGDVRGNASSMGHLYFVDVLKKEKVGDELRFRLRWRAEALKPLTYARPGAKAAKADKPAKVAKPAKAKPAKVKVDKPAKVAKPKKVKATKSIEATVAPETTTPEATAPVAEVVAETTAPETTAPEATAPVAETVPEATATVTE